jgi:hypothetical protein
MRRIMVLVAATALTVLVTSGAALAVTRIGTDGPPRGGPTGTTNW